MTAKKENGVTPDTETSEKPVRDQLRNASISKSDAAGAKMEGEKPAADAEHTDENKKGENGSAEEANGKLQRKRSYEDFEGEQSKAPPAGNTRAHSRKRSRDSTAEELEINNGQRKSSERAREDAEAGESKATNGKPKEPAAAGRERTPEHAGDKRGEAAVEEMTSPKTKRSRLGSVKEEKEGRDTDTAASTTKDAHKTTSSASEEKEKPTAKIPSSSGFANTSASSPFASLAESKSPSAEPAQTSSSAFAASGFSSLSGSSTSGFGAIGKTSGGFGTGGGFGSGSKSPVPTGTETEKAKSPSSSTFGGSLGQQSAFASGGGGSSGFGSKLGQTSAFGGSSGFSSLGGGAGSGGLTSFASGKPSSTLSGSGTPKVAKAFGAADEEGEGDDGEEGGDEEAGPLSHDADKQDERFYQQDLETGEENEQTEYSCRAKLYNFVASGDGKKEWKERGLGTVRLNVKNAARSKEGKEGEGKEEAAEADAKPHARLLMRAEGSYRVILNTPVKKELKFGTPTGEKPTSGYVYFMGAVDSKNSLELLQLKVRQQFAVELYEKVSELQKAM